MTHRLATALLTGGFMTAGICAPAMAQVRASELASVSQTIDGTVMTVEYSRPRARGRDSLFGGVVYWGEVWTPGANWATTFEVNKEVEVNGHPVAAGKYSLWMVVQPDEWTIVLDPNARQFHLDHPDSTASQVRFPVTPQEAPFMEVLTMWFPETASSGTTLATQWGTTYVDFDVTVAPSRPMTLAAESADHYLGSYTMKWNPPPGEEAAAGGGPPPTTVEIYYQDDMLRARAAPAPPWFSDLVLIEVADDWFNPGLLDEDGELYDLMTGLTLEFVMEDGRAQGFDLRWITDEVMASAERQ